MSRPAKAVLGAVLGLVVGCGATGLCAAVIVPWVGDAKRAELGLPIAQKTAVVARHDLDPLTVISYGDLALEDVPERIVTASVIRPDDIKSLPDQILTVPLKAGDLLTWSYFARATPGVEAMDDYVFDACLLAIQARASGPKIERSSANIRARLAAEAR